MKDLVFVALTVAFFVLSLGYVRFCDRIRWGHHERWIHCDAFDLRGDDGLSPVRPSAPGEIL